MGLAREVLVLAKKQQMREDGKGVERKLKYQITKGVGMRATQRQAEHSSDGFAGWRSVSVAVVGAS